MKPKTKEYKLAEVISIVSHQLKTPLSVIKGYIEVLILEDVGRINPKQKEYLKDALENIQKMTGLVKNFLDVSKIEEGKIELRLQPYSLKRIAEESVERFQYLAKAKNCQISFKTKGKIPKLNIDPLKIQQVVNNLISNAIEYNKKRGKVEVTLEKRGKKVIFCCKDSGIGISSKEKKKIFKKFYRSERAIAIVTSGSGLGLFISKAIIEKSRGEIWFKSKIGEGSTFCFSLPIKKP